MRTAMVRWCGREARISALKRQFVAVRKLACKMLNAPNGFAFKPKASVKVRSNFTV